MGELALCGRPAAPRGFRLRARPASAPRPSLLRFGAPTNPPAHVRLAGAAPQPGGLRFAYGYAPEAPEVVEEDPAPGPERSPRAAVTRFFRATGRHRRAAREAEARKEAQAQANARARRRRELERSQRAVARQAAVTEPLAWMMRPAAAAAQDGSSEWLVPRARLETPSALAYAAASNKPRRPASALQQFSTTPRFVERPPSPSTAARPLRSADSLERVATQRPRPRSAVIARRRQPRTPFGRTFRDLWVDERRRRPVPPRPLCSHLVSGKVSAAKRRSRLVRVAGTSGVVG